ncbi:unnamed protein product [Boreogadus saida]
MADSGKANEVGAEAAQPANGEQGLVSRVSNLPLVSSACGAVSSAYASTRDSVPLLKGVMDVAETGVRTWGAAASTGLQAAAEYAGAQITAVSDYALLGLDKMEATLPILQQPADKLVSDTVGRVYQSVAGARDAVTGAVMGAVMGAWSSPKAAVSGGVTHGHEQPPGPDGQQRGGLALSRSETWWSRTPLSERELREGAGEWSSRLGLRLQQQRSWVSRTPSPPLSQRSWGRGSWVSRTSPFRPPQERDLVQYNLPLLPHLPLNKRELEGAGSVEPPPPPHLPLTRELVIEPPPLPLTQRELVGAGAVGGVGLEYWMSMERERMTLMNK